MKDVTNAITTKPYELRQVHELPLVVTEFKTKQNESLRDEYRRLLSKLPVSTIQKFGVEQNETVMGRAVALTGLANLHS